MATSTSALASFNGTSKFASSLQQVLNRAVGIAALPLDSLAASQTKINDRQSALQTLDNAFSALQSSLTTIQNNTKNGIVSSSVSNGSIVSAALDATATAGTYSIEVTSLGSFSSAFSVAGTTQITDPNTQGLTSSAAFTLSVGATSTSVTAASSSLKDVAAAINQQAGTSVQASVVNVGGSGSPDYRLSLRAVKLGADSISLADDTATDLISSSTTGALATYNVNGSGTVSSDSRSVTLAPGVTATLLSQSAAGVVSNIIVKNDASQLAASFSSFAQRYNAAVDAVGRFHGTGAGVLQGDSLLSTLTGILSQLGQYSSGTPETALANYGITLGKDGHLSVDSAALKTAADANFSGFLSVVGDTSSGGFLKTASGLLSSVEDTGTGHIKSAEDSLATQLTALQSRISDQQARVTQLQQNLIQQLSKADTIIAHLESQVSYVNGLFYSITGNNNGSNNPNSI